MFAWKKGCAVLLCLALIISTVPCQAAERWDWNQAYYSFLMDGRYKHSGQKYFDNPDNWEVPKFALHDVNLDGIPELLTYNGCGYTADAHGYLYTFFNGDVVYCGEISYDLSSNFYYEGNLQYPGLFFDGGAMGEFTLYYAKLEGTRLVWENVAEWNFPRSEWQPKEDNPDEYEEVYIEGSYSQITKDNALFDLTKTHLRQYALDENLPSDYSNISDTYSIQSISTMGWDAFTAKFMSASDEESKSIASKPIRFSFTPTDTEQLGIFWETDATHLYSVTGENIITGDSLYSVRAGNPGRYNDDYFEVPDSGIYAFTLHTVDGNTNADVKEDTLYVSVTFAPPQLSETQLAQEANRRGIHDLVTQMNTPWTDEYNLLNYLYWSFDSSFAHIYMGELDDNFEYQASAYGYQLLSDTVGFAVDQFNDRINNPVEAAVMDTVIQYLIRGEDLSTEGLTRLADNADWVSDVVDAVSGVDTNEKAVKSVDKAINSINSYLSRIFPNQHTALTKNTGNFLANHPKLQELFAGHSVSFDDAAKIVGLAAAAADALAKHDRNATVVSVLEGNYSETLRVLGDLYQSAGTEKTRAAIQRITKWVTAKHESDLRQLCDETSEFFKWVLSLGVDLTVDVLSKSASKGAQSVGNILGSIMLGQAIGSVLTKSAADYINTNQRVAANNDAAMLFKHELYNAVNDGKNAALYWLELYVLSVEALYNSTLEAMDILHRDSFLKDFGDVLRRRKGLGETIEKYANNVLVMQVETMQDVINDYIDLVNDASLLRDYTTLPEDIPNLELTTALGLKKEYDEQGDLDFDAITENKNTIMKLYWQIMSIKVLNVVNSANELRRENALESGIVVYYQPEHAVIGDKACKLYTSYNSTDPDDAIQELPTGSTVEILGEMYSTKNGELWYLIYVNGNQFVFIAASDVQR